MSEEVKINITTEADTRGAVDAKAKIVELREEAARLRQSAEVYSAKGGFEDPRARSARSEASAREREANRLERPINTAEKSAQKEERDAKAKALREQRTAEQAAITEARASTRAAARESAEEKKKFAAEDKAEKTAAVIAEREQRKASSTAESQQRKTAAAEKKQEHEEETHRQRFGRAAGGVAGGAAIFAVHEILTELSERQGIALRDQAARTMNARGLATAASWRGTSGQSQADEFAIKQQMDERAANRPDFDRAAGAKGWQHGLAGMGAGAATGAMIGSIVPILGTAVGAVIGAALGGISGALHGNLEGNRSKAERDAAQQRDAELLEEQKKLTRKKFLEEEGGIEMDHARHRAERTQSGQRAAFVDEQKARWLKRYRSLRESGATDAEANQTAQLEGQTAMRDRQIAAGSGLVDARSGAGDIAAAARWAGMSTPGMAEVASAIGALHGTVKGNSQKAEELHGRKDQSVK